jgi:hypothetical protein
LSPTVVIVSPNDDPGIQLLKLLRCLCRRSVLLGDVSQLELLSLPLFLSPTLLMNRPLLTRRFAKFVSSTNRRGMNTVKAGKVLEVCCPKAIYLGSDRIPAGMISTTIQIALPPSPTRTTILDDETLSKLTAEFQGKLLEYRLANYSKVQISAVPGIRVASPSLEIAMNLAACIVNDTELAAGMISLLEEQVRRVSGEPGQTLEAAIVAALLAALHDRKSNRNKGNRGACERAASHAGRDHRVLGGRGWTPAGRIFIMADASQGRKISHLKSRNQQGCAPAGVAARCSVGRGVCDSRMSRL